MIISKFKVFLLGHDDKEIAWLNTMSQTGLNFIRKYGFLYVFEKSDMKYIYAKDFLPKSMPDDLKSNCLERYKNYNINLILKRGNSYYFARDAENGTYTIHETKDHRIMFLNYIRNYLLALISLEIIIFEITFDKISNMNVQIIYILAYVVIAFWIAINYVSVLKQLKAKRQ